MSIDNIRVTVEFYEVYLGLQVWLNIIQAPKVQSVFNLMNILIEHSDGSIIDLKECEVTY